MKTIILMGVALGTLALLSYLLFRYATRYFAKSKMLSAKSIEKLSKKVRRYENNGYVCVTEPFIINVRGDVIYFQQVYNKEYLIKELML